MLRPIQTLGRRFDKGARMPKYNREASSIFAMGNVANMADTMTDAGTEAGERRILVSESAARRIAFLKEQEQAEGAWLRIAVSGGGCSGFQYGLSFDDQQNPDDFLFERDGVGVVVDDTSLDLLNGAEIDFVEDLMGASFQIRNPNAASSCGCGNSFSI
jgi:iron-sulfur cluster insertion protein